MVVRGWSLGIAPPAQRRGREPGGHARADDRGNRGNDPRLPRRALATLQLERRVSSESDTRAAVGNGIAELAPRAAELGSTHPDVLAALGLPDPYAAG